MKLNKLYLFIKTNKRRNRYMKNIISKEDFKKYFNKRQVISKENFIVYINKKICEQKY